ncbi:MAG TPA: hypothetical protein VIY27_06020 [Myxococcota bacterium]
MNKVWSEHQQGRRQNSNDIMMGVNAGADALEVVDKRAADAGVEATFDCGHCGKQTRFFTPWLEMACYFRGDPDPRTGRPFKGTSPTNQGMLVRLRGARCNRINKVLWAWPEVEELVREAVRLRRLPPQVLMFPGGR